MKECPCKPIDISDREIVETDNLKFPWKQDPNGYFLVRLKDNSIQCGFVNNDHKMIMEFRGKNPDNIIKEIAKRKLVEITHMGYISQELQIAKDCLDNKKKYVQR